MKRLSSRHILFASAVLALIFTVLIFWVGRVQKPAGPPREMLQAGIFSLFAAGDYDGYVPLADMLARADFGIGTIDGLDGEMYVRGGVARRVTAGGEVVPVPAETFVPFAMMCRFEPDTVFTFTPVQGATLYETIDRAMGEDSLLLAVQIDGTFSSITTRSVPRQEKPYKTLTEIVATEQVTFECGRSTGAAVGYRIPARMERLNTPGYHIHYISDDGSHGGHVLGFTPENVTVSVQVLDSIRLVGILSL